MKIQEGITLKTLESRLAIFWQLAASKAHSLDSSYDTSQGSPVFTVKGRYTTRGWTEWTQGFQYGIPLLTFLATEDQSMLELGRERTRKNMAHHLSHFGVHDHGFNNLSTYGNLLRAANQGMFDCSEGEKDFYRLAIRLSGAVQARRWTQVKDGGFIYSFNGPHSLFIDTMRTCRILMAAFQLGHRMLEEGDKEIDLYERALIHAKTTASYGVYYGEGRDAFDVRGRCAHESIFNTNDGNYRCPNSQQGYSGYTTWTRGLSWAMLGFTEFLEFMAQREVPTELEAQAKEVFLEAATSTCDFYLDHSAADGIPFWDTGAPQLHRLGRYQDAVSDPENAFEPVDASAAAIGAQALIRLGRLLKNTDPRQSEKYFEAGLTILGTLLSDPYLSKEESHQGILLHSIYHYPNGWDHIPEGSAIPHGESSMWGDYHMTELCYLAQSLELCYLAQSLLKGKDYTFFSNLE
jgi:rhamnogalacturonyl hydrolase YesR